MHEMTIRPPTRGELRQMADDALFLGRSDLADLRNLKPFAEHEDIGQREQRLLDEIEWASATLRDLDGGSSDLNFPM